MPKFPTNLTVYTVSKDILDDNKKYLSVGYGIMYCDYCRRWFECKNMCINLKTNDSMCVLCMESQGIPYADVTDTYENKINKFNGWTI